MHQKPASLGPISGVVRPPAGSLAWNNCGLADMLVATSRSRCLAACNQRRLPDPVTLRNHHFAPPMSTGPGHNGRKRRYKSSSPAFHLPALPRYVVSKSQKVIAGPSHTTRLMVLTNQLSTTISRQPCLGPSPKSTPTLLFPPFRLHPFRRAQLPH